MAIDYEALFGAEEYDPCAALMALRPVYMRLQIEGTVQRITFRDRTTEFHAPQVKELGSLIARLEGECAAIKGRARPRQAITGGFRRA